LLELAERFRLQHQLPSWDLEEFWDFAPRRSSIGIRRYLAHYLATTPRPPAIPNTAWEGYGSGPRGSDDLPPLWLGKLRGMLVSIY